MRKSSDLLKSFDEAFEEYKLLAARANWRLRELQKQGLTTGTAYKSGRRAAMQTHSGGRGGKSFSLSRPKTGRELKARMNLVRGFLSDVTSTPSGVRSVAAGVANKLNARYKGLGLTADNMRDFFNSQVWQRLDSLFGYDTAFKVAASIHKTGGDPTRTLKSLGAKRVSLTPTEKDILKTDIMGQWQTASDREAAMIEAMFKG